MLVEEKPVLKRWCIFIIDDSPDDRAEIRRMLLKGSDRRISFVEASTAAEGLHAIISKGILPDCVVLDYNLPDMSAPEVLISLRGADDMPICPVVVLTGGANRQEGQRVIRAGAQDYIGKDWTNPFALSRSVENACESWGMARELRQHKEASRLLGDREKFRLAFNDATRDLIDEVDIRLEASFLLGCHLNASRVIYGEVNSDGMIVIGSSYVNNVQQIEGCYSLKDYGESLWATLMSGHNAVVADITVDPDYSETERVGYSQMNIVANLGIPILKNARLAAVLGVHQSTPRAWTIEEISTAREIAELTWSAIERARAEKKLAASELQLLQMLEIMPSFSAVLGGPTFIFEMANQSYFDLIGRGSEIIGKSVIEAIPEIIGQPFPALLKQVYSSGKPFEAKAMVVRLPRGPKGALVDLYVDFVYLPLRDADGKVSSVFIHGVDRTIEVRGTQLLLEQDQRKDEFLATLAHELRNPLAPIRNSFKLLKRSPDPEVIKSTLPVMERQLGQLVRLIDDLLDVSRVTSGKIILKKQRINVQEIATVALETSQPLIDTAGHTVTLQWPSEPLWLDADPMRLAQVFGNLLTNAAKYMGHGGHIKFVIQKQGRHVVVSIIDSGFGIPVEMLDQVFELFTQVNRTLDRADGGLGVGLSLVRTLVKMHGGSVQAKSEGVDQGSEFSVTLPLAIKSSSEIYNPVNRGIEVINSDQIVPLKILIVDDNIDAAQTMAMLLSLSGHETRTAFGGQQALDSARTFLPQVMFLDIGLPGMNGYEVAHRLSENPLTAPITLIAITGWGTEADKKKSLAAGFFAHLTKPVDPDEIDAILATLGTT